ncbi:flavoprotein [Suillus subaureus]|uniref:Flavoprotein n=1 Tax=Suillus subaureus TaxID=48587 RepID=A0A9P7EE80_9AGAM|nr:flavoprotein [Suillus subaureus]KAG1818545.1 flavoprotein [Suillus subaureus]
MTGSVASINAPLIVSLLLQYQNVRVEGAADVVKAGAHIGDPILHIELRRWADIVLVAPCSANTLSNDAHGLCDKQYISLLRALAPTTPTYMFLAMNTLMYEHPLTAEHLRVIRNVVCYQAVEPIGKNLAYGTLVFLFKGLGAMTEWRDIVKIVVNKMKLVRKDNKF